MLMIQRGSLPVARDELGSIQTPEATATWTPVPHATLVSLVENAIVSCGLEIASSEFAVWRGGERFFGVLTLGSEHSDYAATVGLRNSHDSELSAAMAIGSRVFCCDNLSFWSEVVIKTRHTSRVLDRLPGVVNTGVARLVDARGEQDKRISLYKTSQVTCQRHLHDLVIRMYRADAIPSTAIAIVIDEYESPSHQEFSDTTLWSLMNATTEVLKSFGSIQPRTQRMHSVLDAEIASQLLTA